MKGCKILIVEDERHIARFLEFILANEGYEIMSVGEGYQALKLLDLFKPDGILLDLGLPDINGIDLLNNIRSHKKFNETKVIILSGSLFEGVSEQLKIAGASAQCSKPIAPSTLVKTLQNLNLLPITAV